MSCQSLQLSQLPYPWRFRLRVSIFWPGRIVTHCDMVSDHPFWSHPYALCIATSTRPRPSDYKHFVVIWRLRESVWYYQSPVMVLISKFAANTAKEHRDSRLVGSLFFSGKMQDMICHLPVPAALLFTHHQVELLQGPHHLHTWTAGPSFVLRFGAKVKQSGTRWVSCHANLLVTQEYIARDGSDLVWSHHWISLMFLPLKLFFIQIWLWFEKLGEVSSKASREVGRVSHFECKIWHVRSPSVQRIQLQP